MTRTRILYLAALLLPLLFLGVQCAYLFYVRTTAPVYSVVLKAYDPRDYVYGRFMQYRYDWDHAESQKPANIEKHDLPETGRFYLPEHAALDLQDMLRQQEKTKFVAYVSFMGKKAIIRDLHVDGKKWQDARTEWLARPVPPPCAAGTPGCAH